MHQATMKLAELSEERTRVLEELDACTDAQRRAELNAMLEELAMREFDACFASA